MQNLQIIVMMLGAVAYAVMATFAFFAYFRLKRQDDDIRAIKNKLDKSLCILFGEHLRSSIGSLNDMKKTLSELVEDEMYEEAERLRKVIAQAEEGVISELEQYKEQFGDDSIKVEVTHVKRNSRNNI